MTDLITWMKHWTNILINMLRKPENHKWADTSIFKIVTLEVEDHTPMVP